MSKPSLSLRTVRTLLEERWGTVTDFRPFTEGLASQVFSFRQGTDDYVLRISSYLTGFQKDAFVTRTFANPRLPIPPVVEVGQLEDGYAFCITRRMTGDRLFDVEAAQFSQLVGAIMELLAHIANADISATIGYGTFNPQGRAPHACWSDFLLSIMNPRYYNWEQVAQQVPTATVEAIYQKIAQRVAACPEARQLIHGDFGSYNVLTDGQQVTAVLDWDRAAVGDALYDVGQLLF